MLQRQLSNGFTMLLLASVSACGGAGYAPAPATASKTDSSLIKVTTSHLIAKTATAPHTAYNPNPIAAVICSDPCKPVIDSKSAMYDSSFFGSKPSFGHITPPNPAIPLASQDAYESISIYEGKSSDPTYTIVPTFNGRIFNTSGQAVKSLTGVHIPNGAMVDHSGEDWLIDIIDSTTGIEYNGYHFNTGSVNSDTGRNTPISGGGTIYAYAVDSVTGSCYSGSVNRCYGGSAGRIPQSLSELDPVEWLQGNITNSLHLVVSCEEGRGAYVYPAGAGGGSISDSRCPPAGEILWLDKTDDQIEAMNQPRWVKTLYHNMHRYGWIPQDSGIATVEGLGPGSLQIVSDYTWTALGQPSQWQLMMNEMKAEGSGALVQTCGAGTCYKIDIPVDSSVSVSDFHWLQLLQQP